MRKFGVPVGVRLREEDRMPSLYLLMGLINQVSVIFRIEMPEAYVQLRTVVNVGRCGCPTDICISISCIFERVRGVVVPYRVNVVQVHCTCAQASRYTVHSGVLAGLPISRDGCSLGN